jgi:hypothetical protein
MLLFHPPTAHVELVPKRFKFIADLIGKPRNYEFNFNELNKKQRTKVLRELAVIDFQWAALSSFKARLTGTWGCPSEDSLQVLQPTYRPGPSYTPCSPSEDTPWRSLTSRRHVSLPIQNGNQPTHDRDVRV